MVTLEKTGSRTPAVAFRLSAARGLRINCTEIDAKFKNAPEKKIPMMKAQAARRT